MTVSSSVHETTCLSTEQDFCKKPVSLFLFLSFPQPLPSPLIHLCCVQGHNHDLPNIAFQVRFPTLVQSLTHQHCSLWLSEHVWLQISASNWCLGHERRCRIRWLHGLPLWLTWITGNWDIKGYLPMDKVILGWLSGKSPCPTPFLFLFMQWILEDVQFNDIFHLVLLGLQPCGCNSHVIHSQRVQTRGC